MEALTRHPVLGRGRPLVFAHRGGAALAPENTLAAFDRGVAAGADGLELDVRLAADGVAVCIHDATLDRTTDRRGPVAALSSAELARIDAAHRFDPDRGHPFRGQGIGVPRLAEVLARHPGVPIIIELKGDDERIAGVAHGEVRAAGALDRVCFGGASPHVMRAVRALGPVVTSAHRREVRWALYRSWVGWRPPAPPAYHAFQVPEVKQGHRIVSRRFIRIAAQAGLVVHVWTVNREADMERLLDWGVQALITDRPDAALGVVARRDPGAVVGSHGQSSPSPAR
jgi:glycerophosphoryl diester phosphodiesterase